MTPERIEELIEYLQVLFDRNDEEWGPSTTWGNAIRDDILSILREKAEQLRAGGGSDRRPLDGLSREESAPQSSPGSLSAAANLMRKVAEQYPDLIHEANLPPAPGSLSDEDEKAFLWLEAECRDCPPCTAFIASLRRRLESKGTGK